MKKLFAFLLIVALASTFAFAGAANEQASTKATADVTVEDLKAANVTIQLWHAQSKENGKAMDMVIDQFNKTNPYNITVVGTFQGGYTDAHTKAVAALAAGNYPNINQAYNNNMMEYMPSGKLMDLTDYLADDFGITKEELDMVYPSYLAENYAFPDGKPYAVALGKSTEVMFYNKTFCDEHGIAVPTTMEELTEAAKKASEILGKPAFAIDSTDNWGIYGPENFGAEYADTAGNIYIYDENNIDKTRAFYEWWEAGIDGGYFRTAGEDNYCSGPFSSGDIIFYVGSSSGTNYILPDGFECEVAKNPVGVNPKVIQQGANFNGFTTGDPIVDLATSIVLEYLYSAEAGALYAANTGYVPANKGALEIDVYKNVLAQDTVQAKAKKVITEYPEDWLAYDPVFKNSYKVRRALSNPLNAIALTDATIDEVIADAKAEIEALK